MKARFEYQIIRLFVTLAVLSLMFVWGLRVVLFAPSESPLNIEQEQSAGLHP